ncbi:MAG: choice-of-anchor D domain-containing protein, partial [Candidatus Cloacimonadaceae bacterium]
RTTVVPYKIWLKTIDSDALTPQPWDELMDGAILVKEGNHAFDSVGWHNFVFDIPFAYTTGNLLIGVQSDCGGNGSSHSAYLYYTTNANLVHQTWSTDGSPSSGNGFLATNLPNIIMHIAPPTDEPAFVVSPDSHDFGEVKIGNDKNSSFTISNVDGGELVINSISISGNPAFTLSNLPTLPVTLGTVETTVFTVNFAPTVLGAASATITIVDNLGNRSEHTVAVSGTGSHYQTIGHAASNLNLPVYPYMDYSYSQSIYLQSEIATQDQRIERLAYYWNGAGTGNRTNGWTIYMGHTSQTAFDSGTGWIPFNQLSQVYSGRPDIPATAGWIEVILDIPFVYNNTDNLVIAVHENIPNYNGYDQFFHCTCTTTNRSLRYFSISTIPDPASPPEGTMARGIPNAKLYLQDIPTTPVLVIQPDALNFGVCTQNLASMPETIILMNYGIGTLNLTADDVNVVGTDAAMFSLITTSLPAALSVGQEVAVGVIFTPTSAGAKSATLRIVYNGQDYDVPLSGYGLPTDPVTVGTGSEVSAYPFYSSYQDARTQMLFTVDELMAAGALPSHFIDHIAFNVSYANTSTLNNLMIRLKTTTATELSGFDTDNDSFSISYLANYAILNLGWIYFEFAEPFFWNGTENLLVDVSFDNNSTTSNSTVNATPAPGKTWVARQQNATGSTLTGGYHQANRPNIRFLFGETASTDPELLISPDVYNFGVVDIGESKSKSIRMLNIGGAPLNIASIEISGSVAFSLSNLPTLPLELEYTQTATFNVVYTPTMTGTDTATITITDDQQNRHTFSLASPGWSVSGRNNRTAHTINISGNSVYGITIGDGGQIASMPIDFHYRTSLYQNIYNADELGYFIGMINGIRFYNQFNNNLSAKPVKIWLASTTQTDLSAGWIPASQMELVFDGTMDFPNGQNVIEF